MAKFVRNHQENMFCKLENLSNESDVEQFFVIRLLTYLGFSDSQIKTKKTLKELSVARGSKNELYRPDYVCYFEEKPKIVVDAKSPKEELEKFVYQVSGYALGLNRKYKNENPVRYAVLTNGGQLKVYNWDEEKPILECNFADFVEGNEKLEILKDILSVQSIKTQTGINDFSLDKFLRKPTVEEVKSAFNKCHNIIWKKEKISPTDAFYEFSKILFVKLNHDTRIHALSEDGKRLSRSDFLFSTSWLDARESETENPLSSILFKDIFDDLQEAIDKNKKKPIFLEDEIALRAPTIKEVVSVLQDFDLYSIDEDLNGRMFETFLNATIRGKELGQYFTPRKVVKFMTKLANPTVRKEDGKYRVDKVLDGCCGSGGFLIDIMAHLLSNVEANKSLAPYKEELLEEIKTNSIWGIEANPKISRVARMNMYAHGDGGSRIYCADSLDQTITIYKGTNKTIKRELDELKQNLVKGELQFDMILTNPPFSMAYSKKDKDEREILLQYASTKEKNNLTYKSGTTTLKASVKSNVLFLARYHKVLKGGGKLLIILDNSVLNSYTHKEYRDFLRSNFIIKAIFQLPTHAFVNQEAGGITSILYLEKRKSEHQEQPPIFAREIKNIGHNTAGRELDFDDFGKVISEFSRFEAEGKLFLFGKKEIGDFEEDLLFLISPDRLQDRLDVYYHQPSYQKLVEDLFRLKERGNYILKKLSEFQRVPNIAASEGRALIYKYVDIGSIDKERGFIREDECEEGTREQLPNRATLYIRENDVIFPKPYRSLGKVAFIPKALDNQLASNGFYGIRPSSREEALVVWSIFRSRLVQKQLHHIASGYTQRELSLDYLYEHLIIPYPKDIKKLAKYIDENIAIATRARKQEIDAITKIADIPDEMLT